ncbi:MAG: hypothetical protein EA393_15685, partial [Bacteroidetes bacterium]
MFRKILFSAFLLFFTGTEQISLFAQTLSDETVSSNSGLQLGTPAGLTLFHETALFNRFTLKAEAGLYASWAAEKVYLNPAFSLEPRWYYNMGLRANRGLNTRFNASNYLYAFGSYRPDWFYGDSGSGDWNHFLLGAGWGMRRNITERLYFELGLGVRKQFFFDSQNPDLPANLWFPHFHLRLGYRL